jgi:hypothetical protein
MTFKTAILIFTGTAVFAVSACAGTLTFNLTADGCTNSCGIPPFGTVTLTDGAPGSNSVLVKETLSPNEYFVGSGAGDALEFNTDLILDKVNPFLDIAFSSISTGFAVGPIPDSASAFGAFQASIACTACQGGKATNPVGPLTFTLTSLIGPLTINDFVANAARYYFAADIYGNNGNTGNVAALASGGPVDPVDPTPEPATMLLTLSGIGLVGIGVIRNKQKA